MKLTNCYATLAEFKARFIPTGLTDTTDDAVIVSVLEGVSRKFDNDLDRWFCPRTATRYYTAEALDLLRVDDLLSVTTLKTDIDNDRVYETVWTTAHYDLEPYNAPLANPPRPYTRIHRAPYGVYAFPRLRKSVEVAGVFGFYDVRSTSSATLNGALDGSSTSVVVTNGAAFSPGMTLLIDSEQLHVQSITSNTLTVTRAANGTTAATHSNGAAIQVYEYPVVNEACLIQAMRLFKRKDAIFGVLAGGEFQKAVQIVKVDPDVEGMLMDLHKWDGALLAV